MGHGETSVLKMLTPEGDEIISRYCGGKGVDLGCGGDKITQEAWGFDLPQPYINQGDDTIEMRGDARDLPFNDSVLDFVYSSALLEDFENTSEVIDEWLRVIKPGGYLILYLPNEQDYRHYCERCGAGRNSAHFHEDMGFDFIKSIMLTKKVEIVYEVPHHWEYMFIIVVRKI